MRLISHVFLALFFVTAAHAKTIHVILDPGHGGPEDWGFTDTGFDEKTINLILAKKIQAQLDTNDKYEVVLTRIGDYPVTLNDRKKTANQYDDSVFISIHSSTYDKEPHVYSYVLKQVSWNQNSMLTPIEFVHGREYKNSVKFAQILQEEFPENMNHKVMLSTFPMATLIGIQSPGILVECQCVSSQSQPTTDANMDEFARNLAEGIESFARKVL